MLAELALYLATPVPSSIRRRGLLADAVSLWSRGRRCRSAWKPHEQRCRAEILRCAAVAPGRDRCVVLGSGQLRDVPLAELAGMFREVVLVDAVHLANVRLRALVRRWSGVRFVVADLSGFDDLVRFRKIALATGQQDVGPKVDPLAAIRALGKADLVVSANLLSQIVSAARRDIASGRSGARLLDEADVRLLAQAHVAGLVAFRCPALLLTDVSYQRRNRLDQVTDEENLAGGAVLPHVTASWNWTVAPFGEEAADEERIHQVVACDISG